MRDNDTSFQALGSQHVLELEARMNHLNINRVISALTGGIGDTTRLRHQSMGELGFVVI